MIKNKIMRTIEFWDSLLFRISNFFQYFIYIVKYFRLKKFLKKNINLSNAHKDEKCFILLNGPSLLDHDLSKLEHEQVFCVNHFWNSNQYNIVKPNYYIAADTSFFSKDNVTENDNYIDKILDLTKNSAKCIFPSSYLELLGNNNLPEHVYITYSKHKSTMTSIRSDLSSISSVFSTVSLYAINNAIGMGFSKIYLLGYDLPPWKGGLMPHAHENTIHELKTEARLIGDEDMFTQCSLHWMYYQAQLENYYLSIHAKKMGVEIYNCSKNSFVRAFKYSNFDDAV